MTRFIYIPEECIGLPIPGHDMRAVTHGIPSASHGIIYFDPSDHSKTGECILLNKPVSAETEEKQLHDDMTIGILDRFFRAIALYQEKHVALPLGHNFYEFLHGTEGTRPHDSHDSPPEERNFLRAFRDAGVDMHHDSRTNFDDDDSTTHNFIHLRGNTWGRIDCPEVNQREFIAFFTRQQTELERRLAPQDYAFLSAYHVFLSHPKGSPESDAALAAMKDVQDAVLQSFAVEVINFQAATKSANPSIAIVLQNPPTQDPFQNLAAFESATRSHFLTHEVAIQRELEGHMLAAQSGRRYETDGSDYTAARYTGMRELREAGISFFRNKPFIQFKEQLSELVRTGVITETFRSELLARATTSRGMGILEQEEIQSFYGGLTEPLKNPNVQEALKNNLITLDEIQQYQRRSGNRAQQFQAMAERKWMVYCETMEDRKGPTSSGS